MEFKATTHILSYLTELANMFRGNSAGKWYYVWLAIHLPTDEILMKGAVFLQRCLSDAVHICHTVEQCFVCLSPTKVSA